MQNFKFGVMREFSSIFNGALHAYEKKLGPRGKITMKSVRDRNILIFF